MCLSSAWIFQRNESSVHDLGAWARGRVTQGTSATIAARLRRQLRWRRLIRFSSVTPLHRKIKKARQGCNGVVGHGRSMCFGTGPGRVLRVHKECGRTSAMRHACPIFRVALCGSAHKGVRETDWKQKDAATKAAHICLRGLFAAHVDPESLQITPSPAR